MSRQRKPIDKNTPRSQAILQRGIRTPQDYVDLMIALMQDTLAERLTPRESNRIARSVKMPTP